LAGEGPLLSLAEKSALWRLAAASAAPGKVLVAGIQAQGVHDAASQIKTAADLGYVAALVDTHHDKLREDFFYRALADRVAIPIVRDLCRSESALWTSLSEGATAAALPMASAAPYACIAVWEAHRTREEEAGQDWQSRIGPAAALIARLGIPALKYAMDLNGFYGGPPRLPWATPLPSEQKEIEQAFANLKS